MGKAGVEVLAVSKIRQVLLGNAFFEKITDDIFSVIVNLCERVELIW